MKLKLRNILPVLLTSVALSQTRTRTGPPEHIHIDGSTWTIQLNNDILKKHLAGETFCNQQLIQYSKESDPFELRDTIWHEIFHAAACDYGGARYWNSDSLAEHKGIFHLAEFMTDFVQTNPEFVKWAGE